MLIYQGTKRTFSQDTENDAIANIIQEKLLERMHHKPSSSEYRAWNNSMEYMYKVLNDQEIPDDCGVAIEYNVPLTAKRVDFILSGYDDDEMGHAEIIELKQWEEVSPVYGKDALVSTYTGGAMREVAHPSYQAWSYADTIKDYNETVQCQKIGLHPCAYMHNYVMSDNDPLAGDFYEEYLKRAPLFTKGMVPELRRFLKAHIKKGDQEAVLKQIDAGKIKPSKSLQDALGSMLDGNDEFILLDDQKVVYENALLLAKQAKTKKQKTVYIVEGGPGTGKSVVAINLLVNLTQAGLTTQYVSKNSAPRNVYEKLLKSNHTAKEIHALFRGSGSFFEAHEHALDVLVVDEAHRLNEKSGLYGNQGENQVKEIINSCWCSIFFIDESQQVTLRDIGSSKEIEKWAKDAGAVIEHAELTSQFRCNGSDGYLAWLDDVLEIKATANYSLEGIDYEFQVIDDPAELESVIRAKNERNKARLLAGYCWEWPTGASRNDTNFHDIEIGDWGISWNLGDTTTFAIDKSSVNEAGCIHTAQGLEFDYAGVIIGDDMRYEDGHIVTDYTKRAKSDKALSGIKKMAKADPAKAQVTADRIIKNTYRTLMTRGMKGCFVYCTDKALADHLKECASEYAYEMVGV